MRHKSPLNGILTGMLAVAIVVAVSLGAHLKKVNGIYEKEMTQRIKAEEKLAQAKKEITKLQKALEKAEKENKSLQAENRAEKKTIKDLNSQVASLQEEVKKLNRLKDSLEESLKNALTDSVVK